MGKVSGVGIIGCGSIVDIAHAPAIIEATNAELVAFAEPNEETRVKMTEKWHPKYSYASFEEMLKNPEVEVVIVASPNAMHCEHALAALSAGKHTIIEKPFACTHGEAWAIVECAKKNNVLVMSGTNQRFWPQNDYARQLIEAGFIGSPMMGRSSLHEAWGLYHEQLSFTNFRAVPALAGGGALFDLGAHRIDLLMHLMGQKPKRVFGIVKRLVTPEDYTTCDDAFYILIEFENGAIGVVDGDRYSPCVSNISEVYGSDGMIFTGSEATNPFQTAPLAVYTHKNFKQEELPKIVKDYRYPQLFWSEDIMQPDGFVPRRWVPIYPPREWAYKRMLVHFLDCVQNGTKPILSPEESAINVDVIGAALISNETGTWVDVPLKEEYVPKGYTKGLK